MYLYVCGVFYLENIQSGNDWVSAEGSEQRTSSCEKELAELDMEVL